MISFLRLLLHRTGGMAPGLSRCDEAVLPACGRRRRWPDCGTACLRARPGADPTVVSWNTTFGKDRREPPRLRESFRFQPIHQRIFKRCTCDGGILTCGLTRVGNCRA